MNEYPTDEELATISKWPITATDDVHKLLEYVRPRWQYNDVGFWDEEKHEDGSIFYISTGGWSGNESIIGALKENFMFWALAWWSSRRGGHYIFSTCRIGTMIKLDDLRKKELE